MIIVLLLCGPPGVGKSTLASKLREKIDQKYNGGESSRIQFENLEFDVVEADRELWDEYSFRSSRENGISELKRILRESADRDSDTIAIVDDIMYLHSMRRAVYVACRDMGVDHLLNVRVTSDLSTALLRNSRRSESRKVTEEVVGKIFVQFEELNDSLPHERHSFIVNCNSDESADKDLPILVNEIDKILTDGIENMRKKNSAGVKNILEDAPVREENDDSRMISIDLILRKAVSSFMRELSSLKSIKQNREMCRNISKIASDVKAEILDGARNSKVRTVESGPGTNIMESDPGTSTVELDSGTCLRHNMKRSGCNTENVGISVEVRLSDEQSTKLHGEVEEGFHENQSTVGRSNSMEHDDLVYEVMNYVHQFKSVLRCRTEFFFASNIPQNLSSCLVPQATADGVLNQTVSADDTSCDAIRDDIFDLLSIH